MAPVAAALEVREKMSESPGHNKMVGLLEDLLNEAVKGRKGATVFRDLFFEETLGAIVKAQGQRICAFDFFRQRNCCAEGTCGAAFARSFRTFGSTGTGVGEGEELERQLEELKQPLQALEAEQS